ncbi:putative reverse transcriptase domain-containing protein [Tanacetum coccineum]
MPPRRLKKKSIKRLVEKRVAKAIEEYEKSRANLDIAGSSGRNTDTEELRCNKKWSKCFKIYKCTEEDKVMFAASTFEGRALTWWNGNVHTLRLVNANCIPWTKFKTMMTTKYCPAIKIQRMEQELWTLTLKGDDIEAYNNRFHELALMCHELVPTEKKKIERATIISESKNGKTTKDTPTTITITTTITTTTTTATETTTITNNKTGGKKLPGPMLQPQLRIEVMMGIYQSATIATFTIVGDALQSVRSAKELVIWRRIVELYFQVHVMISCRMRHVMGVVRKDILRTIKSKCGHGYVLLNDHYACILFDSGAEKNFVSSAFTPFIDISPTTLNTSYEVELADGKVVSTNTVLRSCTLVLLNHVFKIDLLSTRLGSFDVIVGMDWLSYHQAVIDCYEKIVCIPLLNGEILKVQGERPEKDPGSLACIKADEKKLDDIRVVRDFPEVFPDDLSGLPPVREIEFRIDLIPGASPLVKSPYQLAPSEMLELSNQLKELQ